ncbi:hypothetical protein ES703_16801 [subsurface metagenome]
MAASKAEEKLIESLAAIRSLADDSEVLLKAQSPDVDKLLATLQAQAGLQQALLEKLLAVINPSDVEQDLSDTFQLAVQELLDYFRERVRLQGKLADAAALKHLRQE